MSRRSSTGSSKRAPKARARSEAKPSGDRTGGDAPKARARSEAKPSGDRTGGRVLHLDCFSGIAGNMVLGALLDLGLPRKALEAGLEGLGLEYRLVVRRVRRGALAARHVAVRAPREQPQRGFGDIARLLRRADLSPGVRERALGVFEALGRAEARVHGIALEKVHFHEVGAVDAIVDVVGAALGIEWLGVARVTASPVPLGQGRVETAHGTLPLPAPATLELLRGVPTVPAHVAWETVTPTGAAILRGFAESFGPLPAMTVERIGHGAGEERGGPLPNALRAVLGRGAGAGADRVCLLETHLDDLVPEYFDYLMERLLEAGALDVSVQLLQMKKNRPGFLVRVIGRPRDRLPLARILFAESTAIGVRTSEVDRLVLRRESRRVQTPFGPIRVKRVWDPDGRVGVSAEYDDCRRAARRSGVPLREVVRAAEAAGRALEGPAP